MPNRWVFYNNPLHSLIDVAEDLSRFDLPLDTNYVVDDDDDVRIGDLGVIRRKFRSGKVVDLSVIALVEVVADPEPRRNPDNRHGRLKEVDRRAILKITHRMKTPLPMADCVALGMDEPALTNEGRSGSTAPIKRETYELILRLAVERGAETYEIRG